MSANKYRARFKELRESKGIGPRTLAIQIGTKQGSIEKHERGEITLSFLALMKATHYLGCPVSEICAPPFIDNGKWFDMALAALMGTPRMGGGHYETWSECPFCDGCSEPDTDWAPVVHSADCPLPPEWSEPADLGEE